MRKSFSPPRIPPMLGPRSLYSSGEHFAYCSVEDQSPARVRDWKGQLDMVRARSIVKVSGQEIERLDSALEAGKFALRDCEARRMNVEEARRIDKEKVWLSSSLAVPSSQYMVSFATPHASFSAALSSIVEYVSDTVLAIFYVCANTTVCALPCIGALMLQRSRRILDATGL